MGGGVGGVRPWPENSALGHLYQQRAPSPWAFGRGETIHGSDEMEPTRAMPPEEAKDPPLLSVPGGVVGSGDLEGCRKALEALATAEAPSTKDELYVRLCGIFEEEKVKFVMNSHPNESSPQKICSLILTYFPSQ